MPKGLLNFEQPLRHFVPLVLPMFYRHAYSNTKAKQPSFTGRLPGLNMNRRIGVDFIFDYIRV
jgi:hypothetical protein